MENNKFNVGVTLQGHGIGTKILDYMHAAGIEIDGRRVCVSINSDRAPPADIKILFACAAEFTSHLNVNDHDIVMFSNNDEPLTVSFEFMVQNVHLDNAYIVCNSYTHPSHMFHDKIIWNTHDPLITRQYWTSAIFPQYYQNQKLRDIPRDRDLIFINGENRSWRQHYLEQLQERAPRLPIVSNINKVIRETNDAQWETEEDRLFREYVNSNYPVVRNQHSDYQPVKWSFISKNDGLPEEAELTRGYFIMEEFWQYRCVIFPESTWLNNEMAMTEKILKCFFTKSLPFPIGGARINRLYNELGFSTAWNFLPPDLQIYDDILDHRERSKLVVDSIIWLQDNADILSSKDCQDALDRNQIRFLLNPVDHICIPKLTAMLNKAYLTKIQKI